MGKWFDLRLKFKQLVILKHALEDKIRIRKEKIFSTKNCEENSSKLERLEKDLSEEEALYKELSEQIEELRKKFK